MNRDLSKVIVVDDNSSSFAKHKHNGIKVCHPILVLFLWHSFRLPFHHTPPPLFPFSTTQVKPFKGDPADRELFDLLPFLQSMIELRVPDVREVIGSYEGIDVSFLRSS